MKLPIMVLIMVGMIYPSFAEFDNAILGPFSENDLVVVGQIIYAKNIISENKTEYGIDVETYLKATKSFDMVSAVFDGIFPRDYPIVHPINYYNMPIFEEGDLVFAYLKNEDGINKMSPFSFAIEKNEPELGPPVVIETTQPDEFKFSHGKKILISGIIKKAYMYKLEQEGKDSGVHLTIMDDDGKSILSKNLSVSPNGTYEFIFQDVDSPQIPGNYSFDVQFGSTTLNDEFVIEMDLKYWTPLKQHKAGISFGEVSCKPNLVLLEKHDKSPACVKPESKQKLIERGWANS